MSRKENRKTMNDAIKQNAIPAALIGAGVTWLLLGRRGAKDAVAGAGETVETTYRSYPLAAGIASAFAGAALAFALPVGDRERKVLLTLSDKLGQGLKATAKGTAGQVKKATRQVAGRGRRQS